MMRRRRPLVRAAMVGGGAYAAGKARQRSQTRQADEEQQSAATAPAPALAAPAAATGSGDVVDKLKELKELQDAGALTPDQFEAAKQKLLQGS